MPCHVLSKLTVIEGTNRTGTYVGKVRLHSDVPELLPISGRRVRISYPGFKTMCTKCFGSHYKTRCQSAKQQFKDYVIYFAKMNPEFPEAACRRWLELIRAAALGAGPDLHSCSILPISPALEIVSPTTTFLSAPTLPTSSTIITQHDKAQALPVFERLPLLSVQSPATATSDWRRAQQILNQTMPTTTLGINNSVFQDPGLSGLGSGPIKQAPTQAKFRVPQNLIEHNLIVARLVDGGSLPSEAEIVIASRKTAFNKAFREFIHIWLANNY